MTQLSRILAAVDFSEPARGAFNQALALSRAHDAALTVVHAVPANQPFGRHAAERVALRAELRQRAASSGVRVEVSVQHGDPAGVILLHARSRHSDLVVLGTHQRTGLERLRAGSVAERVTLRATQPVLIVPAHSPARAVRSFDNILVAVDFGAASTAALERALLLTRGTNRQLSVVHVTPGRSSTSGPWHATGVPSDLYRFDAGESQWLLGHDAWRRLHGRLLKHFEPAGQVRAQLVTGDPATEIARLASAIDADLIVLGVTERGVLLRTLFGATAARVMRISERPILAVPELTSDAVASGHFDRSRLAA